VVILTAGFLFIASICFSIAFALSFFQFLFLLIKLILVIYLALGTAIATVCCTIANKHLLVVKSHSVTQHVEPLYAFDIHCNSFLPLFVYLGPVQFLLLPLLLKPTFLATLTANALYTLALSHYLYITHLGYRALPFLANTEFFLYPIVVAAGLFAAGLLAWPLGMTPNAAHIAAYLLF